MTDKIEIFTSEQFISKVKLDLDFIVETNDIKRAMESAKGLEGMLKKYGSRIREYKEMAKFYDEALIKLKFIALPLLDDNDAIDLISKYFNWHFHLEDYDLWSKFRQKLMNVVVYEDRDKLKERLKNMLINSDTIIAHSGERKTIKSWLNHYNSSLGSGKADKLKLIQFLTDLDKVKGLSEDNKHRLKVLFDFYERLKYSSLTPEGFEEDIPIVINGKYYIFKQGKLELISGGQERKISGPPRTAEEKEIDKMKIEEEKYMTGGLEQQAIEEEMEKKKKVEDLKAVASKYKPDSLEYKAVMEEIEKIKKQ